MAEKKKYTFEALEDVNTSILAELVADPSTTDHLRVSIINKLLEGKDGQNFFTSMFEEGLSFGSCPSCGHEQHWLIPEDNLNEMGWVTYKKDSRVLQHPTKDDCKTYAEACQKKKVSI